MDGNLVEAILQSAQMNSKEGDIAYLIDDILCLFTDQAVNPTTWPPTNSGNKLFTNELYEAMWQQSDYVRNSERRSKAIAKFLEEPRKKHHQGDNP